MHPDVPIAFIQWRVRYLLNDPDPVFCLILLRHYATIIPKLIIKWIII